MLIAHIVSRMNAGACFQKDLHDVRVTVARGNNNWYVAILHHRKKYPSEADCFKTK